MCMQVASALDKALFSVLTQRTICELLVYFPNEAFKLQSAQELLLAVALHVCAPLLRELQACSGPASTKWGSA